MFGIFKATGNVTETTRSSWDIVNADENIGNPLEVFATLDGAVKALYSNDSYKPASDSIYFVSSINLLDENGDPNDIDNMVNGDGYAIYGLYTDEYEKEYKPATPKITATNFIINGDSGYPYEGIKVEFPAQGDMYDGDTYYIDCADGASVEEIKNLCKFARNDLNYRNIKDCYDLIEDGVTEIKKKMEDNTINDDCIYYHNGRGR